MINRKKIHFILIFTISLIIQSCDDDWVFNVPEMPEFNIIDAQNYDNWVYYNLDDDSIVDITHEESLLSTDWHIAFQRNHVKLNGGLSHIKEDGEEIYYSGSMCGIVNDSQAWTDDLFHSTVQIPDGECLVNEMIQGNMFTFEGCYDPDTHFFTDCVKNPALDQWGYFDTSYHFNVTNYQFFIKKENEDFVKIWLISYYDGNGESGRLFIAQQMLE